MAAGPLNFHRRPTTGEVVDKMTRQVLEHRERTGQSHGPKDAEQIRRELVSTFERADNRKRDSR